MPEVPRLLLAAPASGGGKTTMVCAVLQVLKDRGADPVAFKSGPDYIDPMFHAAVLGVPAHNLDLFLMGEGAVRRSLAVHGSGHGLSLLEGAMGFYDGMGLSERGSAYDLARTTGTPVVLVLDVRGQALTAAALVKGMAAFRPDAPIRGVLFNRCSPMLYPQLKEAVERETALPVLGYLPHLPECTLESRHLGLVTAGELTNLQETLHKLAREAEETIDLKGLLALGQSAPALEIPSRTLPDPPARRPTIAVAKDRAFCFYYADALSLLEELGAELAEFFPLEDHALPEGCSGLYLGGGYPELYAEQLSRNTALLEQIRRAVADGMPTVAECGGFLYLHRHLAGADGAEAPLAGVFPGRAWNRGKLGRFGYVTLTARKGGLLCEEGETLPAHEFHYWESDGPGGDFHAQKPLSGRNWDCAYHTPTLYAGFPHLHFGGCPEAAARFVAACARYERGREG